jgi:hypothetical protein
MILTGRKVWTTALRRAQPIDYCGTGLVDRGRLRWSVVCLPCHEIAITDGKLTLLDSCSGLQVWGSLPLLLLLLCFAAVNYLPDGFLRWVGYLGVGVGIAVHFVIFARAVSQRLRKLEINPDYRKAQVKARWLAYLGFLAFLVLATLSSFVWR